MCLTNHGFTRLIYPIIIKHHYTLNYNRNQMVIDQFVNSFDHLIFNGKRQHVPLLIS